MLCSVTVWKQRWVRLNEWSNIQHVKDRTQWQKLFARQCMTRQVTAELLPTSYDHSLPLCLAQASSSVDALTIPDSCPESWFGAILLPRVIFPCVWITDRHVSTGLLVICLGVPIYNNFLIFRYQGLRPSACCLNCPGGCIHMWACLRPSVA